jgi:hypothetical protein
MNLILGMVINIPTHKPCGTVCEYKIKEFFATSNYSYRVNANFGKVLKI